MICEGCLHFRRTVPWVNNFAVTGCLAKGLTFGLWPEVMAGKVDKNRVFSAVPDSCKQKEVIT